LVWKIAGKIDKTDILSWENATEKLQEFMSFGNSLEMLYKILLFLFFDILPNATDP